MTEGYRTRAAKLTAAARALNAAGGPIAARAPFQLAFMTDPRGPDPILIARVLRRGAIILRERDAARRAALARRLLAVTRDRGTLLLIAEDAALARALGADGVHLKSRQLAAPPDCAGLLVSAACHSAAELRRAAAAGADVALLSPAFPTRSHPGAPALGPARVRSLAAAAGLPVLGLGGVDERNAPLLRGQNVAGFAAIGAFQPR